MLSAQQRCAERLSHFVAWRLITGLILRFGLAEKMIKKLAATPSLSC